MSNKNGNEGKTKRGRGEPEDSVDNVMQRQLAAYGERFLAMFDDERPQNKRAKQQQQQQQKQQQSDGLRGSSTGSEASGDSGRADSDTGSDDDSSSRSKFEDASQQRQGAGKVIEYIFDRKKVVAGGGRSGLAPAGNRQKQPQPQQRSATPISAAADRLKLERKRFMSSNAAVVVGGGQQQQQQGRRRGAAGQQQPQQPAEDGEVSRADFLKMQREVNLLGASALDKRSKKAFEKAMLAEIGAKAAAGPRIGARIGVGMAKKQAQREARTLEEAIAAGMVKQKGMGKRKRREKAAALDRGLNEDRGAFKGGVMRVRPPPGGK